MDGIYYCDILGKHTRWFIDDAAPWASDWRRKPVNAEFRSVCFWLGAEGDPG